MEGFRAIFQGVGDPRKSNAVKHGLIEMLAVALPATLSGSSSCAGFARYAECNCEFLKEFMELKGGPPSHDALSDVSDVIDPEQLSAAMTEFAKTLAEALPQDQVAVDGKALKGAVMDAKKKSALHPVQAFEPRAGLVLGQAEVDGKSNETAAIPALLDLDGRTAAADAMHCQRETSARIVEKGGDCVLPAKGNQGTLNNPIPPRFHPNFDDLGIQLLSENSPKALKQNSPVRGAANSFRGACPPERKQSKIPSDFFAEGGSGRVLKLEKIVMLQELKREGLSISAIARRTGLDRKTVRKLPDRGLAAPAYSPREPRPRLLEPYEDYLAEKIGNCPDLSGRRLFREIRERGYEGGYTAVTAHLRAIRPDAAPRFERRFETRPGEQAQVDFAEFKTECADEPGVFRKVHPFSFVLGCSRWLRGGSAPTRSSRRCRDAMWRPSTHAEGRRKKRLRPDEDRRPGRGRRPVRDPQPVAGRLARPLRIGAQGLQSLPGEDQGQGRATVPLHPAGLLPRPDLPRPRRSRRAIRHLARQDRQSARPRHHRPDRRPGLRRRAMLPDPAARAPPATPS